MHFLLLRSCISTVEHSLPDPHLAVMDRIKRTTLGYSLKNIPVPSTHQYKRHLIEKVESVTRRMRWRAFFFLRGDDVGEEMNGDDDDLAPCFRSKKCPPQVRELIGFEEDLVRMIENIEFRRVSDPFQNTLRKDVERIKNTNEIFVRADKTRNLYSMPKTYYAKLRHDNVTKNYKSGPDHIYDTINAEAKKIARELKIDDRMDVLAKTEAFLTLKDHKDNFENALPCRLINPAKPEMGIISKRILDNIVSALRVKTPINLWKNTAAVIDWFTCIKDKESCTFLCFDIVDFYPSITEKLLKDAMEFAQEHISITEKEMEIIFHSRKSLLFADGKVWVKRERNGLFDVTMGSLDGAEVCELVGAFLLNKMSQFLDHDLAGLYRDDGLAALRGASGHAADATRKNIIRIVKQYGLRITIEVNLKRVNFLDATFDLTTGKYCPYRKPNDQPMYINRLSNHPPSIIRNLPKAISKRVSNISSDRTVFSEATRPYEEALSASGFDNKLEFVDATSSRRRKRTRRRKVIWFNPPFSKNVATNVGRKFLQLVRKHFPPTSQLSKIFNKSTLKISYSCMPNMASIIRASNQKLLNDSRPEKSCNCRVKSACPLEGRCQTESLVYRAQVTSLQSNITKDYIGLSEPPFKLRYANHLTSFRHAKYENSTELSKHVWALKQREEDFDVTWSIVEKARACSSGSRKCGLCLAEKARILSTDPSRRLNKRCEIVSKCRHCNKFSLSNFAPSIT